MDAAGWFYIVDRKKDQINAGGYKVWPREVEDVLYQHEAVREAAVVGVPDAYRGETVKAYVSLRPGQTATPEELIAFCREQMAAYKYPRQVEFLDELPKTVSGKLLRRGSAIAADPEDHLNHDSERAGFPVSVRIEPNRAGSAGHGLPGRGSLRLITEI